MTTVGVDVGGTFLKTIVHDGSGVAIESSERLPSNGVRDHVAGVVGELVKTSDAAAVGVGLAGLVESPPGRFVWGPHMSEGWDSLRGQLEADLAVPVVVDNDANLAAYGEATDGAGRDAESVLAIMFGTGIGAGLVVGGRIHRGRAFAGEVGHMTMLPEGPLCACGRRGCWETLVSGDVLDAASRDIVARNPAGPLARVAGGDAPDASHLALAARSGDPEARAVLARAGVWLGRGVANLIVILDPHIVVLGGAVVQAGEWLLDAAGTAIASHVSGSEHRPATPVIEAHHGRFAGAIGAALAARDALRDGGIHVATNADSPEGSR